jgi:hypothetical protein
VVEGIPHKRWRDSSCNFRPTLRPDRSWGDWVEIANAGAFPLILQAEANVFEWESPERSISERRERVERTESAAEAGAVEIFKRKAPIK